MLQPAPVPKQPDPAIAHQPHPPCPGCLQICLAAAASFVALCSLAGGILGTVLPRRLAGGAVQAAAAVFLGASCLLAASRSTAMVLNYGAPMRIYLNLPEARRLA